MTNFNFTKIREDFPILNQRMGEFPLAYLDNAATSQKPQAVIDAIVEYYTFNNANVHRGVHTLSERATDAYEKARRAVQQFINAPSIKECIFTKGTTDAINLVAQSVVRPLLKPNDEILVSALEHHANLVPWQMIAEKAGAKLRVLPINEKGEWRLEALSECLTEKTRFIALNHISNAIGTINPVEAVIAEAKKHNIPILIDGAQAAPHQMIDVQALGCDFYAFSGHKMYAGTGIGVLWGKTQWLENAEPYQGGGDMIHQVTYEKSTYTGLPNRFEAGTPHIEGAVTLKAAIDYLSTFDKHEANAYENALHDYARARLLEIPGIRLIGDAAHKAPIISFVHDTVHSHDIGTILNSQGVAVRSGHHCAMPLMHCFKVAATTRLSLAFYNTQEDVDQCINALLYVHKLFG